MNEGDPHSPWIGLAPYTEAMHDAFFGRARERRDLLALIDRARLSVLYGISGLGKSSLLQAGVFPVLRGVSCAERISVSGSQRYSTVDVVAPEGST